MRLMVFDPIALIRSFFLLSAATILVIFSIPAFRDRFLSYGARAQSKTDTGKNKNHETATNKSLSHREGLDSELERFLDYLATCCVPHDWFMHFYALSVLLSLLWAYQIATHGVVFNHLARQAASPEGSSMTTQQVAIVWWCLLTQGTRRLLECMRASRSSSTMWILHWVLGLIFYAVINVAIWIEGSSSLLAQPPSFSEFVPPSSLQTLSKYKIWIGLALFAIGTFMQIAAHRHLKDLRYLGSYSLPTHPLFAYTLTPHYFAECVEYFGLSVIAAPPDEYVNKTIICALVFVAVNLGVTAHGTRQWYAQRFGQDRVKGRARMIPMVW